APAPPAAAPAAPAEAGEAFLNINSIPPSTCYLDGRSLGSTPRVHVSVRPGTHTVKFINAEQGLTKSVSVSVGAGETKPAVAKLN
ncbi:MAG TPA: PEGA domain-containing protein, partial [Polyangiaceae bacterium]|nr:PEGA domain-containing protein [Polyangiaceae bacterium]